MTDEKQIEEMARVICNRYSEVTERCRIDNCDCNYACHYYDKAKKLYEQGFCKIPEGSVVLTREEAERFRGQTVNIKKVKAQARKEAVREFIEKIKEEIAYLKRRYHEDCVDGIGDEEYNGLSEKELDELAKQFGIEVE